MIDQYSYIEKKVVKDVIDLSGGYPFEITYETILSGEIEPLVHDIFLWLDTEISSINITRDVGNRLKRPNSLSVQAVSLFLINCKVIGMVQYDESAQPVLSFRIRESTSPDNGIWASASSAKYENMFKKLITSLSPEADNKFMNEVKNRLNVEMTSDGKRIRKALIDGIHVPCKNGVYDRLNKTFLEWEDSSFEDVYGDVAFTFKNQTNYNPNAQNIVIMTDNNGICHSPWDLESHVVSLFDNDLDKCDIYVKAFYEIAAHVISGYSQQIGWFWCNSKNLAAGSSGKSTALAVLKAVVGENQICTNSMNKLMSDPYALSEAVGSVAILSDELEESSSSISDYAALKTLIRMEPTRTRAIYKSAVTITPKMTLVQCCNQVPKFKGASESLFRCIRVLPFEKVFASDKGDAQYIKNDYVKRKSVAEYLLKKCLEEVPVNYSEDVLEITSAKKSIMKASLPVLEFMDSLTEDYSIIADIDIIPAPLLYDMFSNWFEMTNHMKTHLSAQSFWKQLQAWVGTSGEWELVEGIKKLKNEKLYKMDVFYDYPANTANRIWTGCVSYGEIEFRPSKKTFRNGIRFTGVPPRYTKLYLKNIVLKDADGSWHKEYEEFCRLLAEKTTHSPITFEEWVLQWGCANSFNEYRHCMTRQEPDGVDFSLFPVEISTVHIEK